MRLLQCSVPTTDTKADHGADSKRQRVFRNNYRLSVEEEKKDYWKRKCWCEVQKKRSKRSTLEAFTLLDQYQRYDRWEAKNFASVDWQEFYTDITSPHRPLVVLVRPGVLAAGFVMLFLIVYLLLLKFS